RGELPPLRTVGEDGHRLLGGASRCGHLRHHRGGDRRQHPAAVAQDRGADMTDVPSRKGRPSDDMRWTDEMSWMELRQGEEVEVAKSAPHSLHSLLVGIFGVRHDQGETVYLEAHEVQQLALRSTFASMMRKELWSPEMEGSA